MITQAELKAQLSYDPETGIFTRLIAPALRVKAGDVAGSKSHGYLRIVINSTRYYAHRLAWLYVYGSFPARGIDHINGVGTDNRICNLRIASQVENLANTRRHSDGASGFKGVHRTSDGTKWQARCMVNGKAYYLGRFIDINDAAEAYNNFAKQHQGDFYPKGGYED